MEWRKRLEERENVKSKRKQGVVVACGVWFSHYLSLHITGQKGGEIGGKYKGIVVCGLLSWYLRHSDRRIINSFLTFFISLTLPRKFFLFFFIFFCRSCVPLLSCPWWIVYIWWFIPPPRSLHKLFFATTNNLLISHPALPTIPSPLTSNCFLPSAIPPSTVSFSFFFW